MMCEPGMNVIIRNEKESDVEMISEVTKAAFETLAISNHTEQFIAATVSKGRLFKRVGFLSQEDMHKVGEDVKIRLDIH